MAIYEELAVVKSITFSLAPPKLEVVREITIYKDGVELIRRSFSEIYHSWEKDRFEAETPEGLLISTAMPWVPSEAVERRAAIVHVGASSRKVL
jgi:hypothetical protein